MVDDINLRQLDILQMVAAVRQGQKISGVRLIHSAMSETLMFVSEKWTLHFFLIMKDRNAKITSAKFEDKYGVSNLVLYGDSEAFIEDFIMAKLSVSSVSQ